MYNIIPSFTKCFEIKASGGSNPWEKPGTFHAKREQCLIFPGTPRAIDNMHSFYELSNLCCE